MTTSIAELLSDLTLASDQTADFDTNAEVNLLRELIAKAIADASNLGTALYLVLGNTVLDLNDVDSTGFLISTIDLGFPTIRRVASDRAGKDGSDDDTANYSTRVIQLTGALVPTVFGSSRSIVMDSLAPFLAPGARSTLFYALDDDIGIRCFSLLGGPSNLTNPIDHPANASQFSVQFVAQPIAFDPVTSSIDVSFVTPSGEGVSFPLAFPLSFPGGILSTSGDAPVVTGGTYASWPTFRIFGPCIDPAVYWLDPTTADELNIQVVFSGLEIDDGDYVEVDTEANTALLNGDPNASRYNFVDFISTVWGQLQPGSNLLRFSPATATTDSVCRVLWRDNYLS